MITLHLARLEKAPVSLEGEVPAEALDLGKGATFEIASPMHYRISAQLLSGGIIVTGSLHYRISGECGRCLAPVEREIKVDDFTIQLDRPETEAVEIFEEIREEALLVLPYNLLCSEDCKGLCPKCGADLNRKSCRCSLKSESGLPAGDLRWAALDQLNIKLKK